MRAGAALPSIHGADPTRIDALGAYPAPTLVGERGAGLVARAAAKHVAP
jgi:hypothetical protein